jgi:membrane-associated phospholipid phosphatase
MHVYPRKPPEMEHDNNRENLGAQAPRIARNMNTEPSQRHARAAVRGLPPRTRARTKLPGHLVWLGALTSCGWLFLTFSVFAGNGTPFWEQQMYGMLSSIRYPALTEAMVALDRIVVPIALASLLFFLGFHGAKRQWRSLATLAVFASGGALLSQLLKVLVGRIRPPGPSLVDVSGYSFPSGQVLAVALVAGWAIYIASMNANRRRTRLSIEAVAVSAVLLVGFSRIYLGAHYPGDVVASTLIATSWLCACIGARKTIAVAPK